MDTNWLDCHEWNECDGKPTSIGWYAIHYCWDPIEGSFCGVDFWSNEWEESYPIRNFAGPFATQYEAERWVEVNDISN